MRHLKFGAFCLGLAALVGIAVAGLSAQNRVGVRQAPRGNLMMLDGRGSQLGVMVSDLDPTAGKGPEGAGVKSTRSQATARPRRRG